MIEDFSDRQQIETALHQSEEQFRQVFDQAPIGMALEALDERLIRVNRAFCEMLGYTKPELMALNCARITHPDDWEQEIPYVEQLLKGEIDSLKLEKRYLKKNQEILWVNLTAIVLRDQKGEFLYFLGMVEDITERKEAEAKILKALEKERESLQEKEVLLQEIHHRVKNNLQIVCSLLDLQSQYIQEPATKEMFRESYNRIRSMALVHEKLYQCESFTRINFAEYIESLTADLFYTYGVKTSCVVLELDIEQITLNIATAIPCALIINELVSNALKHAFVASQKGRISIALYSEESGHLTLIVKDDGQGIPKNFDLKAAKSLGLQLVQVLTQQLEGTLELDCRNGTEFRISISELT